MQLTVNTSKPYENIIERGCLDELGGRCAALFSAGAKAAVISDSNVFPIYGERAMASLREAGFAPSSFVFPAGEGSKQLSTVGGHARLPRTAGTDAEPTFLWPSAAA